ncbi:MAG: redoxin domain-containing protein [Flavobacteriaceae bacterium]|nr:redoxin domain-containing protein [Flavobacteriaceae bacterium]
MKLKIFILILVVFYSCKSETSFERTPIEVVTDDGVSIEVYDFENFKPFIQQQDNVIYVINFWATWCKPCVEELPAFISLQEKYQDKKVKVLLVSLDFPTKIIEQLIPFIKIKKLAPEVILLDDPDQNTWIPQISEKWSGAIPATLIYYKDKRVFYEQSFTFETLEQAVLAIKK